MTEVREYWNNRAATDNAAPTTNDIHLRELERRSLIDQLRQAGCHGNSHVLDVGCGDGVTLREIGRAFKCQISGMDYSESMLKLANANFAAEPHLNADLRIGDVRSLPVLYAGETFDFVTSDRCLINLETTEAQLQAVRDIADLIRPEGVYLAIENFLEGQERLNKLRAQFGLPPIEVRWHNRFFTEADFRSVASTAFASVEKIDFASAYYLATRVIYSKLCAVDGKAPDYTHAIHELSVQLPFFGDFSPIKLSFARSDTARPTQGRTLTHFSTFESWLPEYAVAKQSDFPE